VCVASSNLKYDLIIIRFLNLLPYNADIVKWVEIQPLSLQLFGHANLKYPTLAEILCMRTLYYEYIIIKTICNNWNIFLLALQPLWALASDFQFHYSSTDGRTPWTSDQLVARPLPNTGQHKHRINTYTNQTFMTCVGFEHTIPASETAKTIHASDRSATVTGL
jgi:hypothetical protein